MRKLINRIIPILFFAAIPLAACSNSNTLTNDEASASSIDITTVKINTVEGLVCFDGYAKVAEEGKDSFINNYSFKTYNDIKKEYKSMKRKINYTFDWYEDPTLDKKIFKEIIIDFETGNLSYSENYFEQSKEKGSVYIETFKTNDGYKVTYSCDIKDGVYDRATKSTSSIVGVTKGYTILPYNKEYMSSFISKMINECLYDEKFLDGYNFDTYKKNNYCIMKYYNSGYVFDDGIAVKKNDGDRTRQTSWWCVSENILEKSEQLTLELKTSEEYKYVQGINLNLDEISLYEVNFSLVYYLAKHLLEDNYFPKEITDDFKITTYR